MSKEKIEINITIDKDVDSIGKFLINFCIQNNLKKFRFSRKDGKRLDWTSEILVRDEFYPDKDKPIEKGARN